LTSAAGNSASPSESDRQANSVPRSIARELTQIVRNDAMTDWRVKETMRAKLRTRIKRLLLQKGWPPDQEPAATALIIEQAEARAEAAE